MHPPAEPCAGHRIGQHAPQPVGDASARQKKPQAARAPFLQQDPPHPRSAPAREFHRAQKDEAHQRECDCPQAKGVCAEQAHPHGDAPSNPECSASFRSAGFLPPRCALRLPCTLLHCGGVRHLNDLWHLDVPRKTQLPSIGFCAPPWTIFHHAATNASKLLRGESACRPSVHRAMPSTFSHRCSRSVPKPLALGRKPAKERPPDKNRGSWYETLCKAGSSQHAEQSPFGSDLSGGMKSTAFCGSIPP